MPGYLDQYGAGEERRNRIIAVSIISVLTLAVLTALGWYLLRNHHQEGVVKTFLADLRRGDYQGAYRDWGCTPQMPCSGYAFDKFMQDWGPKKFRARSRHSGPDRKRVVQYRRSAERRRQSRPRREIMGGQERRRHQLRAFSPLPAQDTVCDHDSSHPRTAEKTTAALNYKVTNEFDYSSHHRRRT